MNGEAQRTFRGAISGAVLGGGLGAAVFGAMGAILVGLEPVVFMVCGIYTGTVYGGIVGALRGAREPRVELAPAIVRSRAA
jgi:hypothetical protein